LPSEAGMIRPARAEGVKVPRQRLESLSYDKKTIVSLKTAFDRGRWLHNETAVLGRLLLWLLSLQPFQAGVEIRAICALVSLVPT